MVEEKAKGSIIFEFLIVVLAAVLVLSIIYPKKISENEELKTTICRERMSDIFNAELQFQKYNLMYSDSLFEVIEFLKTNSQYSTYVDSVIKHGLDSVVTDLNSLLASEDIIIENLAATSDTVMRDSLLNLQQETKMNTRRLAGYVEYLHDKMKFLPNTPMEALKKAFLVVDSKKFTLDMDIVRNAIENEQLTTAQEAIGDVKKNIMEVIADFNDVIDQLDSYKSDSLDSLFNCPTVQKPYKLVHVDTSVVKYIQIYCPIDSQDVQMVQGSFLKSKIGGLNLVNHGKIEKGEKSWESN